MVQFLSINFFSWISSIFVGFFKSFHFFVSSSTFAVLCDSLLCSEQSMPAGQISQTRTGSGVYCWQYALFNNVPFIFECPFHEADSCLIPLCGHYSLLHLSRVHWLRLLKCNVLTMEPGSVMSSLFRARLVSFFSHIMHVQKKWFLGELLNLAGIVKSNQQCIDCDRLCVNCLRTSCGKL